MTVLRNVLTSDPYRQGQLRQQAVRQPVPGPGSGIQFHGRWRDRPRGGPAGANQKQPSEDHRPSRPPDHGERCRLPERRRTPGALFPAQGRQCHLRLRHSCRQGPVRGCAHGPGPAGRHVAGRHRSAGSDDHQAARPGGSEGPGKGQQVPGPLQRPLRPEQRHVGHGVGGLHHPGRRAIRASARTWASSRACKALRSAGSDRGAAAPTEAPERARRTM